MHAAFDIAEERAASRRRQDAARALLSRVGRSASRGELEDAAAVVYRLRSDEERRFLVDAAVDLQESGELGRRLDAAELAGPAVSPPPSAASEPTRSIVLAPLGEAGRGARTQQEPEMTSPEHEANDQPLPGPQDAISAYIAAHPEGRSAAQIKADLRGRFASTSGTPDRVLGSALTQMKTGGRLRYEDGQYFPPAPTQSAAEPHAPTNQESSDAREDHDDTVGRSAGAGGVQDAGDPGRGLIDPSSPRGGFTGRIEAESDAGRLVGVRLEDGSYRVRVEVRTRSVTTFLRVCAGMTAALEQEGCR